MTFAEMLNAEMEKEGFTQPTAARASRIAQQRISDYCAGRVQPGMVHFIKLVRVFPRLLSWLISEAFPSEEERGPQ
jgi:transcriptional regulator with XRE-family HTH domain